MSSDSASESPAPNSRYSRLNPPTQTNPPNTSYAQHSYQSDLHYDEISQPNQSPPDSDTNQTEQRSQTNNKVDESISIGYLTDVFKGDQVKVESHFFFCSFS